MNDIRELYEEVILDHNRNPRNYPKLPDGANYTAMALTLNFKN